MLKEQEGAPSAYVCLCVLGDLLSILKVLFDLNMILILRYYFQCVISLSVVRVDFATKAGVFQVEIVNTRRMVLFTSVISREIINYN